MKNLLTIVLVFLFVERTYAVTNYKLTSVIRDNGGNVSQWVGKRQAVTDYYVGFCNNSIGWLFHLDLDHAWNASSVPMITWEVVGCNGYQAGVMKLVINHTFDEYINQFGDRLKSWLSGIDGIYGTNDDRRVYLRLAHEMNGKWYPWSEGSTPEEYVLAWHHIHDMLSSKGLDSTRVQWVWSVCVRDFTKYTVEEYWVGENYTDWLGIDGYNRGAADSWSKWQWPNEIFDNIIVRLRKLSTTKPISINEYGTTSIRTTNTSDIQSKTEWLNRFCDYLTNSSDIKIASYYNIDDKENDYSIFGGTRGDTMWNNFHAYSAYRNCLLSDQWIETNMSNPRLLTDEQFAGRF